VPTIRIETVIAAPPERCFDLARDIEAHVRSTATTRERAVGARTSGLLGPGDEVTWEATHFAIRQRLTARITRFERPRVFEDVQVRGSFAELHHVHEFEPTPTGTRMVDTFTFRSPLGPLGAVVDRLLLTAYLRRFLERRAAELKSLAESVQERTA
jgi:ligand-binding SRPBCC domain-containing protein